MNPEKSCPKCGIVVDSTWLNCPSDGTWLSALPPEPNPATVPARSPVPQGFTSLLSPGNGAMPQTQVQSTQKRCFVCDASYMASFAACPKDGTPLYLENLTGHVLNGSYQVISVLGEGATSEVYRAKHVYLERDVAVKVLRANLMLDEPMVKRFLQESRAVSSLNHPNIVNLYDFGLTDDKRPYLVMDLLSGESLYQRILSIGPTEQTVAVPLFKRVCDALHHAHLKGIVHRDVKPANMVLTGGTELVKVVDFGLAKIMSWATIESVQSTIDGKVFGSPRYMSPEQCKNQTVDIRSDIYALGVSLFETLSGQPPFNGESALELLMKHINAPAPSIRAEYPQLMVSAELEALICKCLQKDPAARYQTMQEVAAALDGLNSGEAGRLVAPQVRPQRQTTQILIVDDEEVSLLACAMAVRKQSDFEVVGVAINGELALQKVEELKPDLVILDYELPVVNGAEATRLIKKSFPETKVLILSSHSDRATVLRAFSAGADGYVLKSLPGERLFSSIRTIAVGSLWIDDGLDEALVYDARELVYSKFRNEKVLLAGCLSVVEFDLLTLILEEFTDEQICLRLNLGADMLQTHKRAILRMLHSSRKS